jgi:hypothetical protein
VVTLSSVCRPSPSKAYSWTVSFWSFVQTVSRSRLYLYSTRS